MKTFSLCLFLVLASFAALADGTPVVPASQAEVDAGAIMTKYVAPLTLKNWSGAGGGGGATNLTPWTSDINGAGHSLTNGNPALSAR